MDSQTTALFSEIVPIDTLDLFIEKLESTDKNTLIVFDIDEVLMRPVDRLIMMHNKPIYAEWVKRLEAKVGKPESQKLRSLIMAQRKLKLVDPRTPALIENLTRRSLPFVCLTRCWTGGYGIIEDTPNWRIAEMKHLGYELDVTFKDLPPKMFDHMHTDRPKKYPQYKQGILWCCDETKGDVLKAFFDYANYKPASIVFIDDKLHNIESVATFSKQERIAFYGFHYRAAYLEDNPVKPEVATIQQDYLIKTLKWMSDEEVKLL